MNKHLLPKTENYKAKINWKLWVWILPMLVIALYLMNR